MKVQINRLLVLGSPFLFAARTFSFHAINKVAFNHPIHTVVSKLQMRVKKTANSAETGGFKRMAPTYRPKSLNQEIYVKYLSDSNVPIVLGIGPAGCGKTLFACVTAIEELRLGNIQKIVLTRPIVPVEDEELGFLPGDMIEKMAPWTRPIFDIFLEFYQQKDLDAMLTSGVIEISPLAFMRGRTFKRSFIIADEMQNSTPNQMLMLTTRIGENTKMVITGDLKQSDRCTDNGLLDIMNKVRKYYQNVDCNENNDVNVRMIEMGNKDIERSRIVSKMLEIYADPVVAPIKAKFLAVDSSPIPDKVLYFENDAAMIPSALSSKCKSDE